MTKERALQVFGKPQCATTVDTSADDDILERALAARLDEHEMCLHAYAERQIFDPSTGATAAIAAQLGYAGCGTWVR